MEIKVCDTACWSSSEWSSYVSAFNQVFEKSFSVDYFERKYLSTIHKKAYHALLMNEDTVVGGCSVMPYEYEYKNSKISIGLAVDVFILEDFRTDPLLLRRMYNQLKKRLETEGIIAVVAVPNATAYPYWKNIVKWNDVGDIPYYAFPNSLTVVKSSLKVIDPFFKLCTSIFTSLQKPFVCLFKSGKLDQEIRLCKSESFYKHRIDDSYFIFENNGYKLIYKIYNEDGIRTAYILESTYQGSLSSRSLNKALRQIMNDDVDLILYVGVIPFTQCSLFRVPKRFEPKRLPMTCDFVNKKYKETYSEFLNFKAWDFGLINYDVR